MLEPSFHRPALLVVDDDLDIAVLLVELLRKIVNQHDFNVDVELASEIDVLRHIAIRACPFVILDYKLIRTDGLALTKSIKAASPTTVVTLITGYATSELHEKARKAGVDYYLPKPFPIGPFEDFVCRSLQNTPTQPVIESQAILPPLTTAVRIRKQRRLGVLEEQQATMGYETPPHVITEIEDLRRELRGR